MKIRNKLAYLFATMVATLLLLFSAGIYYLTARYRENEFYERLREKAITTARLLYEAKEDITPHTLNLIDQQDSTLLEGEKVTVFNSNLKLIYDSQHNQETMSDEFFRKLGRQPAGELREQQGEREFLYKLYKEPDEVLVVKVSAIDRYGLSKLNFLVGILSFGWFVSVAVIIIAGWIFAGKALEPIEDVIHQVEQIDSETLDKRRVNAGSEKDEIAQLADTFNRMLDRLQQSFVMQRSFVSNASHELRTPLTIMTGQLEVALLQNRSADEYKKILQSVLDDTKDMTELANELLDLAQASSDVYTLPFKQTRIDEVVLLAEAELLKKKPDYDVIVDFTEAPEEEELYELNANERLLKNAFFNLMENACKFSADKKVSIEIAFRPKEVVLAFSDKGVGISEEDLPYIFEPFFRSQQTRSVPGHGIGLPLTKKIVELHGGAIAVESKVNTGTCFTIILPRLSEK